MNCWVGVGSWDDAVHGYPGWLLRSATERLLEEDVAKPLGEHNKHEIAK